MNKSLILVVEDDTSVRNLITTTLKAHEYRYLTAPDGQSAILETSSHNPDIVLLDLGLPDIDGVEIIKKIRTWSNMPIIVISARSEDTDKIDALDAGADDYLTKPFSVEELLARLRVTQRRLSMMQKVSPNIGIASRKIFAQIVKIGFPSALETALYNIAMTFIVRFMNQMDVDGMNVTARSYAVQIANFSYCVGAALAQANAIMTGWRIGAKEFEECNRGTRKAAIYGIITATCFSVTFAFAGHFIVHIFTDDTQMINLVVKLLIVDIFLEFGRVTNLVYGQALKTSGDALFPVILGAIFMYLFAVGGTYFLGIHMGLLAVGAYIAMAGDECARAVGMVLRWKSGKWKSKGLVEV